MSNLDDPKSRGFPESFTTIDRVQVAMLRALASADARLVLKGGMAMRVVVGSMRLTKDVDFDRTNDVSTNAVKASIRKALTHGAQSARLLGSSVDEVTTTPTTVKMSLAGTASGALIRFVVEVSGRSPPADDQYERVTVVPPARYGIAPFVIDAYTHDMLAASKVAAIMSPLRNVPRDVYDLDALAAGHPESILTKQFARDVLKAWRDDAFEKITAITFDQARDELLPSLPPDTRSLFTPAAWEETTLRVAECVDQWLSGALKPRLGPR